MNETPASDAPLLTIMSLHDARAANLTIQGLRPLLVDTLEAATSVLASRVVCGIVIDFALPNQDGLGFVSAVRGHPQTSHVPIIAVGIGTRTSQDMVRACGVNVVLDPLCQVPGVFAEDVSALLMGRRRAPAKFDMSFGDNRPGYFSALSQHDPQTKRRAPGGVRLDAFSRSYACL